MAYRLNIGSNVSYYQLKNTAKWMVPLCKPETCMEKKLKKKKNYDVNHHTYMYLRVHVRSRMFLPMLLINMTTLT